MNPLSFRLNFENSIPAFILSVLLLASSCQMVYHPYHAQAQDLSIDSQYDNETDADLNAIISEYKVELDKEMNAIIGKTAQKLEKAQPESRMGNLVADMIHVYAQTITTEDIQFAVANYGGLRIPDLPAGYITKGKIYELMPFDNYVVVLKTPGSVVRQFCNKIAFYGGWPVSKGLQFRIDNNKAVDIKINGEALDDNKTYQYATVDYIANGGDDCYFLRDYPAIAQGKFLREVMLDEFDQKHKANTTVDAQLENRISIVE